MAVIVFFKTSGVDSHNSSEATDYLLGTHSALTPSLKRQYELQTSGIKYAKEVGDFQLAELLNIERNEIHGKLREPPPVSLSMNTKNVEYAISVTQHKSCLLIRSHKLSPSAIISFATRYPAT